MVAGIGLVVKFKFWILPVEISGINDNTADTGAVSPHPFGEGIHHDVGPVLDRFEQIRRGKGCIDNQRQIVAVSNFSDRADIRKIQHRVADGLDK